MSASVEDEMNAFLKLPYWNTLRSFNLSGPSATTRLLQVPMLGLYLVDISGKFAPHKKAKSTDLSPKSWEEMKRLLENVKPRLNKGHERPEWVPIMYAWELYAGAASSMTDFGHFVFTNGTFTKFLLINTYEEPACNCGNPYHGDYASIIKLQAQKFLNLLTVLNLPRDGCEIDFVRATFCTAAQRVPTDDFLFTEKTLTPPENSFASPIIHLTPADLVPSLTDQDLEMIAATAAKGEVQLSEEKKRLVRTTDSAGRRKVFHPQALPFEHTKEVKRECAGCHKLFLPYKLSRCSGCKMTMYCGTECQKSHWSMHKTICKLVQKNQKA